MESTLLDAMKDERTLVEGWRLDELLRAGYPFDLATKLAVSEADLHLAIDMIGQGCDFATAAEILL